MYQKNCCFYRLNRAFLFMSLLFTFLEESICAEHAMLQACRDAEQDCPHTSRYDCDAGHRRFPLGQSSRTWRKSEKSAELRNGSMRNRGEKKKRKLLQRKRNLNWRAWMLRKSAGVAETCQSNKEQNVFRGKRTKGNLTVRSQNFLQKPGFEPKSLGFFPASTINKYLAECVSLSLGHLSASQFGEDCTQLMDFALMRGKAFPS